MKPEQAERRRLLHGVMLAVLVWGSVLSVGAFLFGPSSDGTITLSPSWPRGLIVFLCVAIFLGGWSLLLRQKSKT